MSEISVWEKVYKVIDSCKTPQQLRAAKKYASLAFAAVSKIDKDKHVIPEYKDEVSYANAMTAINIKESSINKF